MNIENVDDIRDTALKLDKIYKKRPFDFFYVKGWINCLLQEINLTTNNFTDNTIDNAEQKK